MFLFTKEGRTAYLAFVRNLPSQVVLLSPCIFLPKLDTFHASDLSNAAIWLTFFSMFLFAACANFLEFMEAASGRDAFKAAIKEHRAYGLSGWRLFWESLLRISIGEFVSFLIVMFTAYAGFSLVAVMVFWGTGAKP